MKKKTKLKQLKPRKRSNRNKRFKRKLIFTGFNCAGLSSKWQSFNKLINDIKPGAFFAQETKLNKKQKFKIDNPEYKIFRLERQATGGGGLVIGALENLKPVLIKEGDDESEALTVLIEVSTLKVRLVVGYGANESDRQAKKLETTQKERKQKLWEYLDQEITEAENKGQGLVIQIDANAYLGSDIIPNDPNDPNGTGNLFREFLKRNPAITVVNSLQLCKGVITRRRTTINGIEEAALDFFLVNSVMLPFIMEMRVDVHDEYTLTNHAQNKKNEKSVKSDHRPLFLEMNLEFTKIKPQRLEFFNFKSEECQQVFHEITENTTKLSECFRNNFPHLKQAELWQKELERIFQQSFKKRRITNSKKKSDTQEENLLEERRKLIRKLAKNSSPEISLKISEIESELGVKNIQVNTNHMRAQFSLGSKFVSTHNTRGCWSLVRKVRPKHTPPIPVGKIDFEGNMVTDQNSLKKLYLETFIWRLRDRPMKPDLVDLQLLKEKLFKTILKVCKNTKPKPWTEDELEKVLNNLKKDKCRDPTGLINELFFTEKAGKDLKLSMLYLFNNIKETNQIPEFMKIADISSIYKGKGSKNNLKSERGIFIVSVYRSILMKLLYNDKYQTLENHMSYSQIGGRKHMNIRNHLWILNGIIQDVLNRKGSRPIDIQILDIKQCFDVLWPEE